MVLFFCFYKFSSTGLDLSNFFLGIRLDRYAHFIMFFPYPFITWLTCRYSSNNRFIKRHAIVITLLSGIAFACLTEVCQDQFFKSRQGDVYDFLADSVAIVIGTVIVSLAGTPAVNYFDRLIIKHSK
ncbi:MAG TPA: VanZ family protein [Candidatus Coprenecus stercoravium]|uniref:VanZ family protein n=1 Tax=Candidatus Coprenecus stercoravium TaxID=2840735 RepID=A0A9D2GR62_9BACT|nr:VanZ family protein [Candidatus Coprenecus stercoravium]